MSPHMHAPKSMQKFSVTAFSPNAELKHQLCATRVPAFHKRRHSIACTLANVFIGPPFASSHFLLCSCGHIRFPDCSPPYNVLNIRERALERATNSINSARSARAAATAKTAPHDMLAHAESGISSDDCFPRSRAAMWRS